MSLQLLAKQMEAKGRKGDSVLVHMTPSEVAALQEMAESAGGSLSVNPETGLVEANFLKRMLPTLVGIGVGAATMNPYLGAAAGAAVGGYQANRNDQDVGMGMLMGGLGGYGGASMGAGLGAAGNAATSQAATAANPAFMGPMPGAASGFDAVQAGLSSLGNEAGRGAFMQGVGGGAGLAKSVSMAATPLTAAGKRPEDGPIDDEMYSYTFDPGRTGAEETPTDSTAERRYFRNEFSPVRKIRASEYPVYAAQGGLMSLAEGGETAADAAAPALGMPGGIGEATAQVLVYGPDGTMYPNPAAARAAGVTNYTMQQPVTEANEIIPRMPDSGATSTAPTASEAALAYLMGERSSSAPARSPFIDAQLMQGRPAPMAQAPVVGGDNMYAFDPATGTFLRNPDVPGAEVSGSRVGTSFSGSDAPSPNVSLTEAQKQFLDNETPAEREARMEKVSSIIGFAMPGGIFSKGISSLFGSTPQAPAPVDNRYGMATRGGYNSSRGDVGGPGGRGVDGRGSGGMGPSSARAQGGLISLAKGGMASGGFVVPADVVSALGNGSTDAGLRMLKTLMGNVKPIKGKGDGLSDSIPTNIDGKQPAKVADGEAYIDPQTVKRLGGAKKLYAMMDKVRAQAHGKTTQQRKVNPGRVMA